MNRQNHWPMYQPHAIEVKWQQAWERSGLYLALPGDSTRPKFYCLDFFPYPSGDGLHVGHCRNYVPTDVISRYKRMCGYNVLHPMGWDAFGEPAEQFAVKHGVHPRVTTDRNTANFRRQMTLLGCSYDWSREIDSSDPDYYRWTQWFFLLLYRRGLAYRDTSYQWWCPGCQTTLSSHEVQDGVCWRGHPGVTRRMTSAWYFRITAYADELLDGLATIDWPESIKAMQRNWIGRSDGAQVTFPLDAAQAPGQVLQVFTTRPDTLYGATFLAVAPEHPLTGVLATQAHRPEVEVYVDEAIRKGELARMEQVDQKTGVFTGCYAIHPLNGQRIPVWVADYVLPSYGTGAVMGVPAHDQRDYEFAGRYQLPVQVVVSLPANFPMEGAKPASAYTGDGRLMNSGPYDGLSSQEGGERICAALRQGGLGGKAVTYRMHDWLISRQRYWGTPIPIVHCPECGEVPVPEDQLPVQLPHMDNFQPDGSGRSPLARAAEFVHTTCPACSRPAQRETDTMGGFACSSWYFLRFTDPFYTAGPFDPQAVHYWMPVDLYVGGAEHAVLHLLYARFWTRVMADAGLLDFREPFTVLKNQGQLLGQDGRRMAKSRGNVITPDKIAAAYGADALRTYEMFMAPFDQDIAWSQDGIQGARRFLNKVWGLYGDCYQQGAQAAAPDPSLEQQLHITIRRVSERIEAFRFNTMVSALMAFVNTLSERYRQGDWQTASFHQALEILILLLAPAVPHLAEEIWQLTGHAGSVHEQAWPAWDPALAREDIREIAVQVDGKVREVISVPLDASQDEVEALARASKRLQAHLAGKTVQRVVYVPGKILNLVTAC